MDARDEVIRLSELNEGRSKYGEFLQALDAYRDEVRAETFKDAAQWFASLGYGWSAEELNRLSVQGLPYNPMHR